MIVWMLYTTRPPPLIIKAKAISGAARAHPLGAMGMSKGATLATTMEPIRVGPRPQRRLSRAAMRLPRSAPTPSAVRTRPMVVGCSRSPRARCRMSTAQSIWLNRLK